MTAAVAKKKKMIIIGAGLGGLSSGVYAQMNGYETQIYEMHEIPGGCCTSWERQEFIFDWCISWLLGSGDGNQMNQIWNELGALDGKKIRNFEIFNSVVSSAGEKVHFYADPDRLERHLLEISPDDYRPIRQFCDGVREFIKLIDAYPFLKPVGLMGLTEKTKMMLPFLLRYRLIRKSLTTLLSDFSQEFKSPVLRDAFNFIFYEKHPSFPLLPAFFNLACAAKKNAGVPEGGSLELARSIEQRYLELGGQVFYNSKVRNIIVEQDTAKGIRLSDGQEVFADIVLAACDGPSIISRMLPPSLKSKELGQLYDKLLGDETMTFPSYFALFLGVNKDYSGQDHCTTYLLTDEEAKELPGMIHPSINVQVRNIHYPHIAPPGKSVLYVTYFCRYEPWHDLDQQRQTSNRNEPEHMAIHTAARRRSIAYKVAKKKAAEFLIDHLDKVFPDLKDNVECVDVVTPLTQVRYTANHRGTVLAWQPFKESGETIEKQINKYGPKLPGLKNFYMAGHWTTTGGLIRAATTGRHVIQFICRDEGKTFTSFINPRREGAMSSRQVLA